MRFPHRILPVLLPLAAFITHGRAEESWPQFRGANAAGVAESARPPAVFGTDAELAWKAAMPAGISSPIVWGDRIFVTAIDADKPTMLCLKKSDGSILWRGAVPAAQLESVHKTSSPASSTPVTDGTRVIGWFPSFGLVAWDFDGKELWRKPMEMPFVVNGSGTSPIIADGSVILSCDQQAGKSFLLAADAATGETRWQVQRPFAMSGYTTPVVWDRPSGKEIVVAGSLRVTGYSLSDGAEQWFAGGLEAVSVCPTPVTGEGRLYVMSRSLGEAPAPGGLEGLLLVADADKSGGLSRAETPFFQKDGIYDFIDTDRNGSLTAEELRSASDYTKHGQFGIFALTDPGKATGDITTTHTAWKHQKGTAKVSSPLLYRDRLWVIADGGLLTCTDPKTGSVVFERERLGGQAGGDYYASPVAADGRIYVCSTRGTVTVIEAAVPLKILHQTNLGSPILATPALSGGQIFIRTATHLFAFGKPQAQASGEAETKPQPAGN